MRFLTVGEALEIHRRVTKETGGSGGIRDLGALESALAQPRMSFGGEDLYPTIIEKASALAFSLAMNHPFIDGNKRTAHAVMEIFLVLNGFQIEAPVDGQERIMLDLAAGKLERATFTGWLRGHIVAMQADQ
jgi:death-on-curing protein